MAKASAFRRFLFWQDLDSKFLNNARSSGHCPFQVPIPQAQLNDLRRRVSATNWPNRETVNDETQGVQLATMKTIAHYWSTSYDWRKVETGLNAFPQFITTIDGRPAFLIRGA